MADGKSYGWTGKILRVNLGTGAITTQPTDPYKAFVGGMGLANKIMYDEVPAGTDPYSPENKIVFAVGPLTASGVPLSGRTTISTLSPFTKDNLVIDAHCGGMIGAKLKLAGYDALVLEGASDHPVYLKLANNEAEIKDADFIWGMGTRDATEALCRLEGVKCCVAAIGPAGENLLPYSVIINSRNHSAGAGSGAVMGSKKCKAIVVDGNGSVNVANPQEVADLSDYMLRQIIGSNNNHVVPSTQQEWAEYYDESTRWTTRKGLTWGAAEGGPLELGESVPGDINTVGYRCMKAVFDLGDVAEKYTVKMDGCHSCPIHCHSDLRVPQAAEYGASPTAGQTCVAHSPFNTLNTALKAGIEPKSEDALLWNVVTNFKMDELGIWCNYGQLWRDIGYCVTEGVLDRVLPEQEKALFDWNRINQNDVTFINELLDFIARNDSELAHIAYGPFHWTERWDEPDWFDDEHSHLINARGWPVHHANETYGQVGAVTNMMFNRDPMAHPAVNLAGCGLPQEIKEQIATEIWGGPDAITKPKQYTPMTDTRANFTWWNIVTDVLHDSLTLCNWVWPMTVSPTKARNYRGDLDLEAKFYKAVTGEDITTEQLYDAGARIMTLQRANTVRGMSKADGSLGNNNMRGDHDRITEWTFTMDPDIPVYGEGTEKLDREDFQTALTMVYGKFGWDEQLGCPTAECLDHYGMQDVKEELQSLGLLP